MYLYIVQNTNRSDWLFRVTRQLATNLRAQFKSRIDVTLGSRKEGLRRVLQYRSPQAGSPVDSLVVNWGYEPIMPRNVVVWDELPMATHVIVGIYLFAVGECDILLGRHYIKSVYS